MNRPSTWNKAPGALNFIEEPAPRLWTPFDVMPPLPEPALSGREHGQRFATFRDEVQRWVDRLGLKDWYVDFKLDEESTEAEAQVEYDRDTRYATFTYFAAAGKSYPPDRLALHEVLHLLFGDLIPEDCGDDVAREEHRVIERLLHVLL